MKSKMICVWVVVFVLILVSVGQAVPTTYMDATLHNGSFTDGPVDYGAGFWYNTPTAIPTGWVETAQYMYTTGTLWVQCGSLAEAVNNTGETVPGGHAFTVSADLGGGDGIDATVRVYATQNANGTGNKVLLASVNRLGQAGDGYTLFHTVGTPGVMVPMSLAGYYVQVTIGGPYVDHYIAGYYDNIVVTSEEMPPVTSMTYMDATHHNGGFNADSAGFWYNTPLAIPAGWVEITQYMYTTGTLWVQCGSVAEARNNTGEVVPAGHQFTVSADLGGGDDCLATVRVYATENANGTGNKVLLTEISRMGHSADGYNLFTVLGTPDSPTPMSVMGYYVQVVIGGPPENGQYISGYYDNIVVTSVPEPISTEARHPIPDHEETGVVVNPTLSWSPGEYAVSHDVYFSSNQNDVQQALRPRGDINGDGTVNLDDLYILTGQWLQEIDTLPSADLDTDHFVNGIDFASLAQDWLKEAGPAFKGNQTSNSYIPGILEPSTMYYWRIDEVNNSDPDSPWTGPIWQFTTATEITPVHFQEFFDLGMPSALSGSWADYNNDGYADLSAGFDLWKNNAGVTFTKETSFGYGQIYFGSIMADYNNDGFNDVFCYSTRKLYRNVNGQYFVGEVFPNLTMDPSLGASWADHDGDGYIDLYVGGYESASYLPDAIVTNNRPVNLAGYYVQVVLEGGGYYDNIVVISQEGTPKTYMDATLHNGSLTASTYGYWSQTPDAIPAGWVQTAPDVYQTSGQWVQTGTYAQATNNTGEVVVASHQITVSADLGGQTGTTAMVRVYATQNPNGTGNKVLLAEVRRPGNGADGYSLFPVSSTGSTYGNFVQTWTQTGNIYPARGITSCDFDEDGDMDIYVSNYRLAPNLLWRNDGTGNFTDVAATYGVDGAVAYWGYRHTIGSAWSDLDNDGHFDLFVGNFAHPAGVFGAGTPRQGESQFLRNLGPSGNWHFEDMSAGAGLAYQESYTTPALGDYDNDGYLDLFFTTSYPVGSYGVENHSVLYHNNGDWTFTDVTAAVGLNGQSLDYNCQAAWADFDNDGDLDLVTAGKIYKNLGNSNHWLEVRLQGDGVNVNRSAIGAQVRITMPNGKILTRQVEAGTGQGNQNDLKLHFGLGGYADPVDLEIFWTDGVTTAYHTETNRIIVISR